MKAADSCRDARTSSTGTRKRLTCLLGFLCFLATAVAGEDRVCLSRTVLTGVSGNSYELLSPADFRVTVGGKAAAVQSVKVPDAPPRVILLLDGSANHDQSTWAATQRIADEFLANFPGSGDFTLVMFDDKVERVVHEMDRATLQGNVGEIFPSGKHESAAGLADAVKQSSVSFGGYRQGDTEFLITTLDRMQKETEQVLGQQITAGIRLFGVSFDESTLPGPPPFGGVTTVKDYTRIEGLAKASGGTWIRFGTSAKDAVALSESAKAAGKSTSALVRNYLIVDLRLASAITKPEKLKIELVKEARGKGEDRFTAYPRELFPCQ